MPSPPAPAVSATTPGGPVIITVCMTCRSAGVAREEAAGLALLSAVRQAAGQDPAVIVRAAQCLGVCNRVCTVAISGEGRYTFLLGDLDPREHGEAVVTMARACADAPHGFVPWKDRPEPLRKCGIARVPPPGWSPDDGSAPA